MNISGTTQIYFRVKEKSFIARFAAWKLTCDKVAIVIGKTIHLHNTRKQEFLQNRRWLLHELKHIEQFQKHGIARFIFLYLWESIRHGYTNNKYEIEARASETDEKLFNIIRPCEDLTMKEGLLKITERKS
ncbi:MAG: DUF4157 domain-containing protein [Chitinophagaceae bacterium]